MNYENLTMLPAINEVTLIGNLTFEQLGLVDMSTEDMSELFLEVFGYEI